MSFEFLDPQIVSHARAIDENMLDRDASIAELRSRYSGLLAEQGRPNPAVTKRDISIPTRHGSIQARLYTPPTAARIPLLVYMHGGGFMVGDLDGLDVPLSNLSSSSGIAILSLDYALAPEHPYPIALEQCGDAIGWASEHSASLGCSAELGIGGDSAGGNMTALLALRCRDAGGPDIAWQALINPVLDFFGADQEKTASHRDFADGPILTREIMQMLNSGYFADDNARTAASPMLQSDFAHLPPAFIAAAECDPLRDDSVGYAEKLRAAGVPVELFVYPGMCHNFITLTHISDVARAFIADMAASARTNLKAAGA